MRLVMACGIYFIVLYFNCNQIVTNFRQFCRQRVVTVVLLYLASAVIKLVYNEIPGSCLDKALQLGFIWRNYLHIFLAYLIILAFHRILVHLLRILP